MLAAIDAIEYYIKSYTYFVLQEWIVLVVSRILHLDFLPLNLRCNTFMFIPTSKHNSNNDGSDDITDYGKVICKNGVK